MYRRLSYLVSVFLLCGAFLSTASLAQEKESQYNTKSATALISADVYDELVKAQDAQSKGDYKTAISVLDGLKARTGRKALKPYELAQMWNFYAYAYLAKEDYSSAIKAFEQLLAQPDLPVQLINSTRYTLAQLYFANEKVDKAISILEAWFKTAENPAPEAYVLLTQMYVQKERIDPALKTLLKAFKVAKEQKKEEKENWYALLQYLYSEKKQYKNQLNALEVLVNRWPKKTYWMALANAYAEQQMDKKQLAAMDSAYQQDMLDSENYLLVYAQLLAANDEPFQAAKVLDKGLQNKTIEETAKNLERVGEYYRRAKETKKALPYLEKAAKASDSGEVALRLAYVYLNNYQYKEAAEAAELALNKGHVRKRLDVYFLQARAEFYAGEYEKARRTLHKVRGVAKKKEHKKHLKQAKQWLEFIDAEEKRQKDIQEYLHS